MTIETAILGLVLLYGIYQFVFTIGYLLRHKWRLHLLHKQVYYQLISDICRLYRANHKTRRILSRRE